MWQILWWSRTFDFLSQKIKLYFCGIENVDVFEMIRAISCPEIM